MLYSFLILISSVTTFAPIHCVNRVVSYPAKVQIFQLITTALQGGYWVRSCFLPCKGTNFSANHNQKRERSVRLLGCFLPCKGTNFSANHNVIGEENLYCLVVSYPAKVQIFQLITTRARSKVGQYCCFLPCKGTNFSANHNA